jgi:hypothetical protein
MYKTLLINKLNPQDFTKKKKNIFFLIGGINVPTIENKLVDILNNSDLLSENEIIYKYNGVELKIDVQAIPEIIKLLSKEEFSIYSVYEIYNPDV